VFHQRLVEGMTGLGMQSWEDDPDFLLANHVTRTTLPAPGDERALQTYIESVVKVPLDRSRPLWEVHEIEGYRQGSAIVTRFHHALADGIALAEVMLSLTDESAEEPDPEHLDTGAAPTPRGRLSLPGWGTAQRLAAGVAGLRPSLLGDALRLTQQTTLIADKLLLGSNPRTPLIGEPGIDKRAVWSSARPIAEVKRIARLADATVNDVLVGAVSGALSAYVVDHGGEAEDLTTMVPVNVRPVGEPLPRELGNKFALVLLPLPLGTRAPMARLAETKRRMDSIKHSPEAFITFGLINAIGNTHPRVEELLVNFFSSKAIGVTTNVIGPMTDRYVAGSPIAGVLGWVPGSGRQTVGVCIFSYNGTVRVGFKVDAGVVPDPERLVEAFDQELDDLARMSRAV
jgi:WS/DGAT/MGAT family acyltransferase